jgi:co-chaperonin GroES (HSP10)
MEKIPTLSGSAGVPDPEALVWAFPEVDPGQAPLGSRVIVQLRRVKQRSAAGLFLVSETKENEKWQNMIGKVIAIGPLAFRNRDTMEDWPEGVWVKPGDFVRVPRWGGDRWERPVSENAPDAEPVLFMTINDHEIIARVTADPLSFKVFV